METPEEMYPNRPKLTIKTPEQRHCVCCLVWTDFPHRSTVPIVSVYIVHFEKVNACEEHTTFFGFYKNCNNNYSAELFWMVKCVFSFGLFEIKHDNMNCDLSSFYTISSQEIVVNVFVNSSVFIIFTLHKLKIHFSHN